MYDVKKPHENYGNLIWQDGVLYALDGTILPKDPVKLVAKGYNPQISLRQKLFGYSEELRIQKEYEEKMLQIEQMKAEREENFRRSLQALQEQAYSQTSQVTQQQAWEDLMPDPVQLDVPILPEELVSGALNEMIDQGVPANQLPTREEVEVQQPTFIPPPPPPLAAHLGIDGEPAHQVVGGGAPSTNWVSATPPPVIPPFEQVAAAAQQKPKVNRRQRVNID
jgi:hypothetical protein